jgi:hypothetical protein
MALLLAVCAIAIGFVAEKYDLPYDWRPFAGAAVAIVIVGVTLLYTLADHPNAEPKRLWKTVALPLACVMAIVGALLVVNQVESNKIGTRPDELSDTEFPPDQLAKLQGRAQFLNEELHLTVYNGSSWAVKEIVAHVEMHPMEKKDIFDQISPDATPQANGHFVPDATPRFDPTKPYTNVSQPAGQIAPDATSAPKHPWDSDPIVGGEPAQTISRDLRLTKEYDVDPLETSLFTTFVGIEPGANQKWSWKIVRASGHPR